MVEASPSSPPAPPQPPGAGLAYSQQQLPPLAPLQQPPLSRDPRSPPPAHHHHHQLPPLASQQLQQALQHRLHRAPSLEHVSTIATAAAGPLGRTPAVAPLGSLAPAPPGGQQPPPPPPPPLPSAAHGTGTVAQSAMPAGGTSSTTASAGAVGTASGPPVYDYGTVSTVREVWQEYRTGLAGQPSVESLDAAWGSRWRPEPRGRTWYSRRKVVWDKIKELVADGLDEDDAVAEVERMRGGGTINRLIRILQDEKKNASTAGAGSVASVAAAAAAASTASPPAGTAPAEAADAGSTRRASSSSSAPLATTLPLSTASSATAPSAGHVGWKVNHHQQDESKRPSLPPVTLPPLSLPSAQQHQQSQTKMEGYGSQQQTH